MKPPFFKWLICLFTFLTMELCVESATVNFIEKPIYGTSFVQLENAYLQVIIDPDNGARIKSLVQKATGHDLAYWQGESGANLGLMRDISPSIPHPGDMYDAVYKVNLIPDKKDEVSCEFYFDHRSQSARGIRYRKIFTLRENEPFLRITLEMENNGFLERKIDWRIHNMILPSGQFDPDNEICLAPTVNGITVKSENKPPYFFTDFTDGWMAIINKKEKEGIVVRNHYDDLAKMLFWVSTDPPSSTMEWVYNEVALKQGDIFRTDVQLMPTSGLSSIDGVCDLGVLELLLSERILRIYGLQDGTIEVKIKYLLPGQVEKILLEKSVLLNKGKVSTVKFDRPVKGSQTLGIHFSFAGKDYFFIKPLIKSYQIVQPDRQPTQIISGTPPKKRIIIIPK
ncbi:MAG: hypothetical protein V2A65_06635 [Candidatus Omnitrophota bacterium]